MISEPPIGPLPRACMAAFQSCASQTPFTRKSHTFNTRPANSPPSTTRPQLILPMVTSRRGGTSPHARPRVRLVSPWAQDPRRHCATIFETGDWTARRSVTTFGRAMVARVRHHSVDRRLLPPRRTGGGRRVGERRPALLLPHEGRGGR